MSLFNRREKKALSLERDKDFKINQFIKIDGLRRNKKEKFEPSVFVSPIFGTTVKDVAVAPHVNENTGDKVKQLDFLREKPLLDPKEYHEFKSTIIDTETRREVFGDQVYIDRERKYVNPLEKENKIHVPFTGKENEVSFADALYEKEHERTFSPPLFESELDEIKEEMPQFVEVEAVKEEIKPVEPVVEDEPTEEPFDYEAYLKELEPDVVDGIPEFVEDEEPIIVTEEIKPEPVTKPVYERPKRKPYTLPSPSMFKKVAREQDATPEWLTNQKDVINRTLEQFNVPGEVENIIKGPTVTRHEIKLASGINVNRVSQIEDNLKMELAARSLRIEAPIPGKPYVGLELPNEVAEIVAFGNVIDDPEFLNSDSKLQIALGVDIDGTNIYDDITKMPHGLVGGATNSGKSVCINTIIMSLLMKNHPDDLKFILIDPKMVELTIYNDIPHLATPVITEPKMASTALSWAVGEMDRRFVRLSQSFTKDIVSYNKKAETDHSLEKMPYIVIVIDELADLMMVSSADVEDSIQRLTQKARAAGIHLIVATQRPTTDVVKGTIKANILTRIAFRVSSFIDSTTILDVAGAEKLLGRGDMLLKRDDRPTRLQGAYITDEEIHRVTDFIRQQMEPDYLINFEDLQSFSVNKELTETDELLVDVAEFVFLEGSASINAIQKQFNVGFNRAQRLVEILESLGYVSAPDGKKPREVLLTREALEDLKNG